MVGMHVVMTNAQVTAAVLYIFLTYVFESVQILPLLAITSPVKRCGKTRLLQVLSGLVRRPLPVSNITPAALYRLVEKWKPCLLIDEADTFLGSYDELRGILNAGHTRHVAYVVRWNPEKEREEVFNTFAPKIVALIGSLPATLSDRAIELSLARKRSDQRVSRVPLNPLDAWRELRRKLVRWAEDIQDELSLDVEPPDVGNDRASDNWTPLLAIARALGDDWEAKARQAMMDLEGSKDDDSIRIRLLADIKTIFDRLDTEKISTRDLLLHLTEDETAPWDDWRNGRPLTAHGLARLLKPFGITPKTIRFEMDVSKGYQREDFKEAWDRYLPPSRNVTPLQSRNNAQKSPIQNVTREAYVTDSICEEGARLSQCYGVTFQKEGGRRENKMKPDLLLEEEVEG